MKVMSWGPCYARYATKLCYECKLMYDVLMLCKLCDVPRYASKSHVKKFTMHVNDVSYVYGKHMLS